MLKKNLIIPIQTGFTLIEILIALLVLSIGLLGMAGLQTNSLVQSHKAFLRSQATVLALDMVDRLRANRSAVTAGSYDDILGGKTDYTKPSCYAAGDCDSAGIAALDVYEWTNEANPGSVASLLPAGKGMIKKTVDNVFLVTVLWDQDRSGKSGANCSGDPSVDLHCLTLEVPL